MAADGNGGGHLGKGYPAFVLSSLADCLRQVLLETDYPQLTGFYCSECDHLWWLNFDPVHLLHHPSLHDVDHGQQSWLHGQYGVSSNSNKAIMTILPDPPRVNGEALLPV